MSGGGRLGGRLGDRGRLLILCGVMAVMIVAVCVLAPSTQENDPRPTITNVGPRGAKAAFLTLTALGVRTSAWEHPLAELNADLSDAQVARTTLILAEPRYDATQEKDLAGAVNRFLERGGRVLATGASGARLLPGGEVSPAGLLASGACRTTPEGPGALARAGRVEMMNAAQWSKDGPRYVVEQRCGKDAVVVRFSVGKGEAVWWSSATPMENAGLKDDASLRLLLASVGAGPGLGGDAGRDVVFGESLYGAVKTLWDEAKGLAAALAGVAGGAAVCAAGGELQPEARAGESAGEVAAELAGGVCCVDGGFVREGRGE